MVQVFNWAFAKKSELGDPVGDKEITEDVRAEVGRSMLQTQLARSQCDVTGETLHCIALLAS